MVAALAGSLAGGTSVLIWRVADVMQELGEDLVATDLTAADHGARLRCLEAARPDCAHQRRW